MRTNEERHAEMRARLKTLYHDAEYAAAVGCKYRLQEIEREISWLELQAATIGTIEG